MLLAQTCQNLEALLSHFIIQSTENKNKMEDGNKALIHNFHKQLVQQLQLLHNAVESSVEQHQQQLKVIEEKTQSFVPKKDKVIIVLLELLLTSLATNIS